MRIVATVTIVAVLSATTVPALADQFEWGPLVTQPKDDHSRRPGPSIIRPGRDNDVLPHFVGDACPR